MATTFLKVKNRALSTLASDITDSDLSLTVAAGEGVLFPSTYPFHITIEDEILTCTNRSTDTLTVTRAAEGTSAAAHTAGKAVALRITAQLLSDLNAAVNALENAGFLANVEEDLTPTLGGNVDTNGKHIGAINQLNSIENQSKLLQTEDIFADFVVSGLLPATSSDLTSDISAGKAYISGVRVVKGTTSHTYTASKDTYVDLDSQGNYHFVEVNNGDAEPAVTTDSIRLAKVVTDASTITTVTGMRNIRRLYVDSSGTVIIDKQMSIGKTFSLHGGYGNVMDLAGGTTIQRDLDTVYTYLLSGFDTSNNLLGAIYIEPASGNAFVFKNASNGSIIEFDATDESGSLIGVMYMKYNSVKVKQNLGLNTTDFGGGDEVIGIANATTVPTANPTGGGVLYVENGDLKYRNPSGDIATMGGGFQSGFQVTRAVDQSISASTNTKVQFRSEKLDALGEYDSDTNYRFTAQAAGRYLFDVDLSFTLSVADHDAQLKIYKNGSFANSVYITATSTSYTCGHLSWLIPLAANDYVEIYFESDVDATIKSGSAFSGQRVY